MGLQYYGSHLELKKHCSSVFFEHPTGVPRHSDLGRDADLLVQGSVNLKGHSSDCPSPHPVQVDSESLAGPS